MRIVALYDIHGNPDALEAVLSDPAAAGADAVVVGGDVVPGPFAAETLERLAGLDVPAHWVRGNGEREVAAAVGKPAPDPEDILAVIAHVTAEALGADGVRGFAELPTSIEVDGVLFCHATPHSDEAFLTRRSPDSRYERALAGVTASLVVAGHTHQQHDRRVGTVRFVNAGSVGLPYEGDGDARWLLVVDGEPELRRTAYDARAAGERMLASGWPDARSTHGGLIDPIDPEAITEIFEAQAGS